MRDPELNRTLGKLAADAALRRNTTGRSRLVKVTAGGVADALKAGPTPAAHHQPSRYGCKT